MNYWLDEGYINGINESCNQKNYKNFWRKKWKLKIIILSLQTN